jgi:hypothetical protein
MIILLPGEHIQEEKYALTIKSYIAVEYFEVLA